MRIVQVTLAGCVAMVIAMGVYQCTPATEAKVATTAIDLIKCLDNNIGQTEEQTAINCGIALTTDLINLIAERKNIAAAKKTCPSCVDAGSIPGK